MNILMVASPIVSLRQPFKGGTESFLVNLSNALCQRGHIVEVLCKDSDENNEFSTIQLDESPLRMQDNLISEKEGQKLYQAAQFGLIDFSKYDIIHYHSYYHAIYDMALLHSVSSVVTLHAPVSKQLGLVHRLHKARSDHKYVAVSQRLRKEWEKEIGSGIDVIPNGVSFPSTLSIDTLERDSSYFWMGRINPEKDIMSAIKIARALKRKIKFAGPIEDPGYFNEQVEPLLDGNVEYLGHLKHGILFRELAKSSLFLATSRWDEPFGLTTVEALSVGVPVVGFDTAIPEELRHEPVCQIGQDIDDVISRIKCMPEVSREACQSFARQFDFQRTVSEYEKVYEQLIQ
ncbi:glycosyltransferase [Alteromonas oceanisediminis]|uniref:glycosyltransferase n=1 Tax=Alteromonas oceanisediminis TaxID=2836180 RepID=UPI001BDA07A9|nr:glycosyltransferase [Alteromonas oceanisediminis]MBT0587081.1 glycosyltransferase [Alteromonas oceanisediminis]